MIGKQKFSFDLWGDTVNTASRMESTSEPGMIQVSQQIAEAIESRFDVRARGMITMKGKGDLHTFELMAADRLRRGR